MEIKKIKLKSEQIYSNPSHLSGFQFLHNKNETDFLNEIQLLWYNFITNFIPKNSKQRIFINRSNQLLILEIFDFKYTLKVAITNTNIPEALKQ